MGLFNRRKSDDELRRMAWEQEQKEEERFQANMRAKEREELERRAGVWKEKDDYVPERWD